MADGLEKSLTDPEDSKSFLRSAQDYLIGEIGEETFRKLRLLHGVYRQRQTGQYMLRVRIPWGGLTSGQLERIADLSETCANGHAHITTRQNLQFYGLNLIQAADMIRHLAVEGVTTREASGNVVRNITACHLSGVCDKEIFDATPYAESLTRYLIRHPDFQNLPRKFKIAFSACAKDCALTQIHDLGLVARVKDGQKGFKVFVGGGLGSVPKQAQVLEEFVSADLMAPTVCAVLQTFNQYGTREVKARARLKFLVETLGINHFKELVVQERNRLASSIPSFKIESTDRNTVHGGVCYDKTNFELDFLNWCNTNAARQKQDGFFSVHVTVPFGDINSGQMKVIARLAREFSNEKIRTTNKQNLLISWIKGEHIFTVYQSLKDSGLNAPCNDRVCDITSCPGAGSCPSAITNSKALAAELVRFFQNGGRKFKEIPSVIKISGCHNSCAHHHVASIGLSGRSQKTGEEQVPYYELYLAAKESSDFKFSEPICKIPARRVPLALSRILHYYEKEKLTGESLEEFFHRSGTDSFEILLESLTNLQLLPIAEHELKDWGSEDNFQLKVNPSEC